MSADCDCEREHGLCPPLIWPCCNKNSVLILASHDQRLCTAAGKHALANLHVHCLLPVYHGHLCSVWQPSANEPSHHQVPALLDISNVKMCWRTSMLICPLQMTADVRRRPHHGTVCSVRVRCRVTPEKGAVQTIIHKLHMVTGRISLACTSSSQRGWLPCQGAESRAACTWPKHHTPCAL